MPASLKEVAAKVGLSDTTVSLVLRGKGDHRFPQATRERVLAAARELDYQPNAGARYLRGQRTNMIGFFTSVGLATAHDAFFSEIVAGMRVACSERSKKFVLFGHYSQERDDDAYADIMSGQLDGLVVLMQPHEPLVKRLAATSLPVVAIADVIPEFPSVVADDRGGSRMLAEYLAQRGHRRVLYRVHAENETDECVSRVRRHRAFREEASRLGMSVVESVAQYPSAEEYYIQLSSVEAGYLAEPDGQRPTAAACWDDFAARCLIAECRKIGIRVPEDLAVVGFDGCDSRIPDDATRLTTIRADWSNVVRTATELLQRMIDGNEVPMETIVPAHLVAGDTA
jgi:DNA-binding LacI/PurR family transcriptional regulator